MSELSPLCLSARLPSLFLAHLCALRDNQPPGERSPTSAAKACHPGRVPLLFISKNEVSVMRDAPPLTDGVGVDVCVWWCVVVRFSIVLH